MGFRNLLTGLHHGSSSIHELSSHMPHLNISLNSDKKNIQPESGSFECMREIDLVVSPEVGFDEANLSAFLRQAGECSSEEYIQITRRSIDARQKQVKVNLRVQIHPNPVSVEFVEYIRTDHQVSTCPEVIIIGTGPAGLFAALKAIENGIRPILIERGKDVQSRRRDLAAINQQHVVNPDSNYCFGEGGAGTYSDGKLYTRSKKRGSMRRIFEIFVSHGAPEEILIEAHPHIGTNRLPKIITALRQTIEAAGGQILFNCRVTDFILEKNVLKGVILQNGTTIRGMATVLATGHSARDIFHLCYQRGIAIEAKPFALGVRVEHPQQLIDRIQYHCEDRGNYLPASAYGLVTQTSYDGVERGVFSFCMCPGGFIVPAATSPGEVVVNGMSPSRRNSRFANSGIVVAVEHNDLKAFHHHGPLASLEFQASVERTAWEAGGKTQMAPGQRLGDFVNGKFSDQLNDTSYQPGIASAKMDQILPKFIGERLRQGFKHFDRKMKGYLTNEAQILGVESRTSSPVRIPRDPETLRHPEVGGLYPCGEGAGYAGGIVSAAMDGERVMEQVIRLVKS